MPEIRLEIKSRHVEQELGRILRHVQYTRPLMAQISNELLSLTEKAFDREGHPDKWPTLALSTIRSRTRKGYWPGQILQVSTVGLAASIQPWHGDREAGIGAGAGKSKAYAVIHQFGGQAGRGLKTTIPARPFLPVRSIGNDEVELTKEAADSILEVTMAFVLPK
jgi:phage virion morphogenesis protein